MRLRPGVTMTEADDAAVLLDERNGRYRQLNATAVLVLRSLLSGGGPAEAARELARAHPGAAPTAEADVEALLARLRAADLIDETSLP
ncbi:hypothetical protein GCM10009850_051820 [Nonomuraea monospora]|uniref:Lasso peptide biosynthesis PqqD family chaperone n=1 Tax=Nonomuraea monospora TaxID=568818 RepID=A0ABN3CJX0_9ACTN